MRTSALHSAVDALDQGFTREAAYVESVAGDDELLILSAGMDVRAAAVAASDKPDVPSALNASAGDVEGEIDLMCDPVASAKSYVWEQSPDPPTATSWEHAGVSTKSRITIGKLKPGTRYWFRVAALGTQGQSGWSDPATKLAP